MENAMEPAARAEQVCCEGLMGQWYQKQAVSLRGPGNSHAKKKLNYFQSEASLLQTPAPINP